MKLYTISEREREFAKVVSDALQEHCMIDCPLSEQEKNNLVVRCCDRVAYICKGSDSSLEYGEKIANVRYKGDPNKKRIILILESPHKDEFKLDGCKLCQVGPAAGKTGTYIRKYLPLIFSGMKDFGARELILVNAIQFRCSIGRSMWGKENANGMKFKNRVLTELLAKEMFVMDLERRLKLVWRNADMDMIVNCLSLNGATGCVVGKIIKRVTGRCVCGIGHPSRWFSTWETARSVAGRLYEFTI